MLIPAVVTEVYPTPNFCNCTVESTHGRRPDGAKERISAINTGVLLRANDGDINEIVFE